MVILFPGIKSTLSPFLFDIRMESLNALFGKTGPQEVGLMELGYVVKDLDNNDFMCAIILITH